MKKKVFFFVFISKTLHTCIIHDDMLFTHELCNFFVQDAFTYYRIMIQYDFYVIKVCPSVQFSYDFFWWNCLQ